MGIYGHKKIFGTTLFNNRYFTIIRELWVAEQRQSPGIFFRNFLYIRYGLKSVYRFLQSGLVAEL